MGIGSGGVGRCLCGTCEVGGGGDRREGFDGFEVVGLDCCACDGGWPGLAAANNCMTEGTRGMDIVLMARGLSRKVGEGEVSRGGRLCIVTVKDRKQVSDYVQRNEEANE